MLIELTPREVEACRRLKKYTEMQLAEELYDAIAKPENYDLQSKKFMECVREMCEDALVFIEQIANLLIESKVKKDDNEVNEMLRKAGPLSVYYLIGEASKDLDKKNKRYKEIEKTREDKINNYKKDIRTLEKTERKLNKNINTLLYKISSTELQAADDDFKKCQLGDSVKGIISPDTQKIIGENDKLLDEIKGDKQDNDLRKKVVEGKKEKDGYFEVKKHLDLEISRLYSKIEWQKEYAEGLKRQATTDNCSKKLEVNHIITLLSQTKALSPSDCSDIFRLLGTMMEELDKLSDDDWEKLYTYYAKPDAIKEINLGDLKFCIQLQSLLRETSGLDIKGLFPNMPPMLANNLKMPDQYQIDRDSRYVKYCKVCGQVDNEKGVKEKKDQMMKYSYMCPRGHRFEETYKETEARTKTRCIHYKCTEDVEVQSREWLCGVHKDKPLANMIEQKLKCSNCKQEVKLYFEPAKHSKEKAAKGKCPKCNKVDAKFEPVGGVRPFWKDDIRARWRDTWSSTFILEYNSVVRAIDRTFGLPEGADISGTTADSIFGMEAVAALKRRGEESYGTGGAKELATEKAKNKYWFKNYIASKGYPGYVILLPLITMVKLGHHAILECALTFTLTGYIDAYHIGKYTTLWPKESATDGPLWKILKYWEEAASNKRIIIERDEDGFVTGGWLFEENSYIGKFEFEDVTKLDYQRYINVFLPLRDRMKKQDENIEEDQQKEGGDESENENKIDLSFIEKLMVDSDKDLNKLELEILKENAKRLQESGGKNYKNYKEGLKYYSDQCSKGKIEKDDDFKEKLKELSEQHTIKDAAPV